MPRCVETRYSSTYLPTLGTYLPSGSPEQKTNNRKSSSQKSIFRGTVVLCMYSTVLSTERVCSLSSFQIGTLEGGIPCHAQHARAIARISTTPIRTKKLGNSSGLRAPGKSIAGNGWSWLGLPPYPGRQSEAAARRGSPEVH